MSYIRDLLAEARTGDPVAVEEVLDFVEHVLEQPDRRVCTAFGLNRRGGQNPARAAQRRKRNEYLAELTVIQSGDKESLRIQAARSKLERYAANGWPHEQGKPTETGNRERDLLRKIMRTGLPIVQARQHRVILRALKKN
jgi:hypothetical protein